MGSTFYVDYFGGPTLEEKGIFDNIVAAAGGKPLPGRWGLVQALFNCVAQPRMGTHPALHWTKVGLNAVGIYQAHRIAEDPKKAPRLRDPIKEYLEANGLVSIPELESLVGLLLHYSASLPHQDLRPGGEQREDWIRLFKLPKSKVTFAFSLWKGSGTYEGREIGLGPFVEKKDHGTFMREINEIIWGAEGNADLELTAQRRNYSPVSFTLANIGEPDDFVSNGDGRGVDRIVHRCKAFAAQGKARHLLFYGPPGTGKTTLARTVARHLGQGRTLRVEPEAMTHAGVNAVLGFLHVLRPRVVLFDDMDRCMNNVVDLLHMFEQGHNSLGCMFVGTINVIDAVDPALLRPGRFDEVVEIAEPDEGHRSRIIDHYLEKNGLPSELKERVLQLTDKFSPADVREVLSCAATVGIEHLEDEAKRVARQRELYAGEACKKFADRTLMAKSGEKSSPPG